VLCEMFATLGLGGKGTSEEQAIELNDVNPEDFEMLFHYYNDFQSVILFRSLSFDVLTRWVGHKGFLSVLPPSNTGKD